MGYHMNMRTSVMIAALLSASLLQACASVRLPDIDFMGDSDFSEELAELDTSFPGADETPDRPDDVRSDKEWDNAARDMQALFDDVDVPELEPSLSDEAFNQEFETAQQAAKAYQEDDPS